MGDKGSWDISEWLNQNGPTMAFHPHTIEIIGEILDKAGYKTTGDWSWSL